MKLFCRFEIVNFFFTHALSKSTSFVTNGLIECGSVCSAIDDCLLFVEEKTSKNCYMGQLNNIDTNFLSSPSESMNPQVVYMNMNTIGNFNLGAILKPRGQIFWVFQPPLPPMWTDVVF